MFHIRPGSTNSARGSSTPWRVFQCPISPGLPDRALLARPPHDVVLCSFIARVGEDLSGLTFFNQIAEVEERRALRHPRGLLHRVRDDDDGVVLALNSWMSSSTIAVAIGSSAEHGSSIRMTSGLVAIARAMHRRCCWPPERPGTGLLEAVLDFLQQPRAFQARFDQLRRVQPSSTSDRGCAGHRRCSRRSTSGTGWASGTPCQRVHAVRRRRDPARRCRRHRA